MQELDQEIGALEAMQNDGTSHDGWGKDDRFVLIDEDKELKRLFDEHELDLDERVRYSSGKFLGELFNGTHRVARVHFDHQPSYLNHIIPFGAMVKSLDPNVTILDFHSNN